MTIYIIYKEKYKAEQIKGIDSIHETPNGLMLITPLKGVQAINKSDIQSVTVEF
jgi:hypothetical protein